MMSALMLLTSMPGFKGEETDSNSDNDLYPQLLTIFDEENKTSSDDLAWVKCNVILSNYQFSHDQCSNLELSTRNQTVSQLWYNHQKGIITGTKTHDVLVRRDNAVTALSTFLPKLL